MKNEDYCLLNVDICVFEASKGIRQKGDLRLTDVSASALLSWLHQGSSIHQICLNLLAPTTLPHQTPGLVGWGSAFRFIFPHLASPIWYIFFC